mmetsp:Transcript_26525/g.12472  ORF Transcript_26525/g.12472 Transcript_26525/m.12472 type:complete len:143 (-) Transcript_26525:28-456(-)
MLNFKAFCEWVWKAMYQGAIIILMSIILFETDSFINLQAITFTSLIFIEFLNIYSDVERYHWVMLGASLLSLLIYYISMMFMPSVFPMNYIFSWEFMWRVLTIVGLAWLPILLYNIVVRLCDPPEYTKVMQGRVMRLLSLNI